MKKYISLIAVAAVLMTVSCAKENTAPEVQEGKTIQLTLNATRGEADTKTAISLNDTYKSLESAWAAGDVIYVYSIKSGEELGTLTQTGAIVNERTSATSQYSTSYAAFMGSITLGGGDDISDTFAFVYQGSGRALSVSSSLLTYDMGTSADVAGLNAWDVAYATGKIQGTAPSASCAVSFSNKVAFGYFSTTDVASGSDITVKYYSSFTLNVKNGAITGKSGTVDVPGNAAFYMPLVPGTVNMSTAKSWSTDNGYLGYTTIQQQNSFSAAAGNYYRLGSAGSYGPVEFHITAWTKYETLRDSKFDVAAAKKVHFTQGNLQWISTNAVDATVGYWRIAPTQYSYLGAGNARGNAGTTGSKLNAGNVDVFGWGEVEPPFLCSTINGDYQPGISTGTNLTTDWATKFNGITPTALYADYDATQAYPKPDGDGNYCVLTKDEWRYLFAHQYWGFATVNLAVGGSVTGLVICPNTITTSDAATALGLTTVYKSSDKRTGKTAAFNENVIDQSVIDSNGLLFLPAAGYRGGYGTASGMGEYGYYWSITSSYTDGYAVYVRFLTTDFDSASGYSRYLGNSVRLATVTD